MAICDLMNWPTWYVVIFMLKRRRRANQIRKLFFNFSHVLLSGLLTLLKMCIFNKTFKVLNIPLGDNVVYNSITNQSSVSTAKRLASLFWYLIASTIDTLHNTINGYEIACIWKSEYNVHVCMIQTISDFIFQKLIVFVSCWL